ncbi:MAG: hypothetical protein ABI576_14700 [Flavobacterium sp.]
MKKLFLLIVVFLIFNACHINGQQKFDKERWQIKKEGNFLYRNEMLDDLVANVQLKGLSRNELIGLLGESENMQSSDKELFYPIIQKYEEPIHIIFLAICIDGTDIVDYFEIIDNRKTKSKILKN